MKKQAEGCKAPTAQKSGRIAILLDKAREHVANRRPISAENICTKIIDDGKCSDAERIEAYNIRGKALVIAGHLPSAALDFYKVLEADHNHSEAYGYILQIGADTGLPLTKI